MQSGIEICIITDHSIVTAVKSGERKMNAKNTCVIHAALNEKNILAADNTSKHSTIMELTGK
jgi:hypothetical protein